MNTPEKIYNIVVAAGSGSRFGSELPKQYCLLNDRPVLMHAIENLQKSVPGATTILVLNSDFISYWNELCGKHSFPSPIVTAGGDTRWQSVKNAIDFIKANVTDDTIITIHDGARPIVDKDMIDRVLDAARRQSGAIPAIPVTDSLRQINADGGSFPVDRSRFRAVQTPQAFQGAKLIKAYSLPYSPAFTDDASVMASAGYNDIEIVEGSPANIKITHPLDIEIARVYLNAK